LLPAGEDINTAGEPTLFGLLTGESTTALRGEPEEEEEEEEVCGDLAAAASGKRA